MIKKTLISLTIALLSSQAISAQLDEIVSEAVLTNPEVKRNLHARNAVYEEIKQAKGGFLPRIDMAAGIGYEWTKNNATANASGGDEDLTRQEASISINQMLFDGFLTDSEVERHTARLEAKNHHLREVSEEKALEITRAYIELVKRQELLNQANETLYNHVKVYEQIRKRSESGLGTKASIQQAEGRLALAEVNVLSAQNNLEDVRVTFQRLTGKPAPKSLEAPDFHACPIPITSEEAVSRALSNHPTLSLAMADVNAAVSQYDAARSAMYPKLNLEIDRNWNKDIDGTRGKNEDLTAMLRLRYNLYRGGSDTARIKETQHQINEAKSIQNNAYREVVETVELAWNAYIILGKQLAFLEKHVVSSTETRDSYLKQFNIGQRSLLDLLDTENEVFSSKNSYIEAKYDQLASQYRLLNGMGEILDVLNVNLDSFASADFEEQNLEFEREVKEKTES